MAYTIVYVIFFLYLCGVFEKRVAMKLRKLGIVVLGCVLLMEMAACSKDKEEVSPDGSTPAQVDPRDAFVGDYTYEATGFMHINDLPLPLFDSLPLNDKGEATIAKEGDANKILLIANNDTIRAEVSGNQLRLDSNSVTLNYNKFKFQMVIINDRANLTGKRIDWESDIMAEGTYDKYSITGDGHMKIVADKKEGK